MKIGFPLISVIVPNYNHEKYLNQRLECIFNQTYSNFEVILLDDCSTDKSQEILLEYAKNPKVSHCIFNTTNSGNTFVQWNKGIALAEGEYIWVAESDDFCDLQFLEKLVQPFLLDPEINLVYCQSNRVNEADTITGNWFNHTEGLDPFLFLTNFVMDGNVFIEKFLIYKNVIPNASAVLFKKKMVLQLGELDIDPVLRTCGDWLFYLKLVTNHKLAFVAESLNNFRYHSQSVIAGAVQKMTWARIIEIDFIMRRKMLDFLSEEEPYNFEAISKTNNQIVRNLTYERGMYYYGNNKKIKGLLIVGGVFDIFVKKYNFKKKLM